MKDNITFKNFCKLIYKKSTKNMKNNKIIPQHLYLEVIKEISDISCKTLNAIMNVFINENSIVGSSPEEQYENFNLYSGSGEFYNFIVDNYPGLIYKIEYLIKSRINNILTLLHRFDNDKEILSSTFKFDADRLNDCYIYSGTSDIHNGEQNFIIEFNNKKIVYKTRGASTDNFWNEIINWVNYKLGEQVLFGVNVIDRKEYSWHEFIEYDAIDNKVGIEDFYYKTGVLSCLAYIFDLSDLHFENFICSNKGPIIIDLETICQIPIKAKEDEKLDVFEKIISDSILKTELFPCSNWKVEINTDISGICGYNSLAMNEQIMENNKIFHEQTYSSLKKESFDLKNNIPKLNGIYVDPRDYKDWIIKGFENGYKIAIKNKEGLLEMIRSNNDFKLIRSRVVFHDTQLYHDIINYSTLPSNLSDIEPKEITAAIKKICENYNDVLEEDILENTLKGNIPIYHRKINSLNIETSTGKICYTQKITPYNQLINKIDTLGLKDLKLQKEIINLSLIKFRGKTYNKKFNMNEIMKNNIIFSSDELIYESKIIAEKIVNKAIFTDQCLVNWLTIENNFPNWEIKFQDCSLYSGLSGNAIYFSTIYNISKDARYLKILNKILYTISETYKNSKKSPSSFAGTFSVAYLYLFLYSQGFGSFYYEKALKVIFDHNEEIINNGYYDLFDGLAGNLLVLLGAQKIKKNIEVEKLIVEVKRNLIDGLLNKNDIYYWKNNQILTGLAHGASGIIYALSELYLRTLDLELLTYINNLIKYENLYFYEKELNWGDICFEPDTNEENTTIQWCHGAVGIGLSRLKVNEIFNVTNDIIRAKTITIKRGLYKENDSICHGNFGNLEFLNLVHRQFKDEKTRKIIHYRISEIIKENKRTYKSGLSKDFESVDLMLGLSGIGYQCLKFIFEELPSICLLEI